MSLHPETTFTAAITATANLLVTVTCRDLAALYAFVTTKVGPLPAVRQVETVPPCTGSSRREPASATGACPPPDATMRQGRRHIPARHGHEAGMDRQSENLQEPQSEPLVAGLAPPDELETDEVPDSLVSEFSSLTTPYCWVITEDAVAGYDGAEPSAVGKSGPGHAVAGDVTEALNAGRFFRLVDGKGHELAIGRLYDPSGQNELAPLDDFGRQNLGALNIEFRAEGDWQAA